jgi:hypothetical protein
MPSGMARPDRSCEDASPRVRGSPRPPSRHRRERLEVPTAIPPRSVGSRPNPAPASTPARSLSNSAPSAPARTRLHPEVLSRTHNRLHRPQPRLATPLTAARRRQPYQRPESKARALNRRPLLGLRSEMRVRRLIPRGRRERQASLGHHWKGPAQSVPRGRSKGRARSAPKGSRGDQPTLSAPRTRRASESTLPASVSCLVGRSYEARSSSSPGWCTSTPTRWSEHLRAPRDGPMLPRPIVSAHRGNQGRP